MTKEELDAIRERCKKVSYTAVAQDRASAESYIYQNIKDIYMLLSGVDAAIKRADEAERAAIKILERFRNKCGWCRDYDKCEHGRDWDACNKQVFQISTESVIANEKLLDDLEAERDRLRARAEALERALRQAVNGDCSACKFKDDENAVCCSDGIDRWDFDQARFERKEAGEP